MQADATLAFVLRNRWVLATALAVVAAGAVWHYHFVAYPEPAASLRLPGLAERVCGARPIDPATGRCGNRAVEVSTGWGVAVDVRVYGVASTVEAGEIAWFITQLRKRQQQERIPVDLEVVATPRSAGGAGPRVFERRL